MYAALGVYNTMLQVIDLKNRRKRDARELETIIEYRMMQVSDRNAKAWRGIATSDYADLNLNIEDLYERLENAIVNDYARIEEMFAMRGVEPDAAIVAGWYTYEAMEKAYAAAYMTLITLMDDVNEAYGWKHFQISNLEYRRYLSDLHFETIRGEQNTSIDEKAILQLMIYAAYNGLDLKTPIDKIGGSKRYFNIQDLFRVASNVQCIGWLKEYHKVQFGAEWEQIHKVFGEMMALTEGPLINKFRAEVEYSEPLQIIWDKVGDTDESKQRIQDGFRGDAIFQTIDQDFWRSGELTGTVQAYFDYDFRYMPSPQYAVVSFFAGDPGCLSAETLIETISGPRRIADVMGQKESESSLPGKRRSALLSDRAIPIQNKRQMLYRLTTSSGIVLATADHKFLQLGGQWQTLENLNVGDRIAAFGKETRMRARATKEMREPRLSKGNLPARRKQTPFLQPNLRQNYSGETDSQKEDHSHLPKYRLPSSRRIACPRHDELGMGLEQVRTRSGQILISRFSDQEFHFRNRSEWGSLASGFTTGRGTFDTFANGWTLSDNTYRDGYSTGPARISQVLLSSPLKELVRPTLLTYMYQEQTTTS